MPLIRNGRFIADDWQALTDSDAISADNALISFARLESEQPAIASFPGKLGVSIANTLRPEALQPYFKGLDLIVIPFPAFNDGRGFSLAKRLRRLGFRGVLRAKGHIIPDQYAYATSCGFDEIEISDALAARQPQPHWQAAFAAMTLGYQAGYQGPQNILQARHAARVQGFRSQAA